MTKRNGLIILMVILLLGLVVWHFLPQKSATISQTALLSLPQSEPKTPITPLMLPDNLNPEWVALGAKLFHDPQLSRNKQISCAHCHLADKGGADGRSHSIGIDGQQGFNNASSIWNAAQHIRRRWDGTPKTLEDQAFMPATSFFEMANTPEGIINTVKQDPYYAEIFEKLFSEGVTKQTISLTISEFERSLVSINSPFDRWLLGDSKAISEQAIRGYERFQHLGCIACHQGALVGGNMFEKMGVFHDYFQDRGHVESADFGRYNVTGAERNRFEFKVASLRNVALTAPYFHDGSVPTLAGAIKTMAYYQLGLTLDDTAIDDIKAFLETLTGDVPASLANVK